MNITQKNDFLKEGYLDKLGGMIQSWKDRYFVLTPNELSMFEDKTLKLKIVTISLNNIGTITMKPPRDGKCNVFIISTTSETFTLNASSPADRDEWSKAILAAKNNNPVAGNQKMVYSRVPQELTPERAQSYFLHIGRRLTEAKSTTVIDAFLCMASWISRTYNDKNVLQMNQDVVKQILDTVFKVSNNVKRQLMSDGSWDSEMETSYNEVISTIDYINYIVAKSKLLNVQKEDITNPKDRGVPKSGFYDKYIKKAHLGSGSFGDVYEAEQIETKKRFAAKIMNKKKMSKDDIFYLHREVKSMALVVHPNFVYLEQFYETSNEYIIVMEIANGITLNDEAMNHRDWSEVDVMNIFKNLSLAIKYLHDIGLAHRDLKPENILFTPTGQMKIADFGFAKLIDDGLNTGCGSPLYIAPEILEKKRYNEKVDIWSLGVILYQLLCGFVPFHDANSARLFKKIKSGVFSFPSPFWDNISKSAQDLIEHMLRVDPKKRYSSKKVVSHSWFREGEKLNKKRLEASNYLKTFRQNANNIIKRGYVNKPGSYLPTWKRRSLALYSDKLAYFESETSTNIKDSFLLNTIKSVIIPVDSPHQFTLEFTNKPKLEIKCDTEEDATIWKDFILSARRSYYILDLASKAFFSGRIVDAIEDLIECRQNINMYQNINTINLWRYISWKSTKLSCAAIWNINSVYLPHAHIICMSSYKIGDDDFVICGCSEGILQHVNLTTGTNNNFICHNNSDVLTLSVQEATGTMVSGGANGTLCFWDINRMVLHDTILVDSGKIISVCVSQNRPIAISVIKKGHVYVWDIHERKKLHSFKGVKHATMGGITKNYIIICIKKKILIYDINTYKEVVILLAHEKYVVALGIYQREDIFISGGDDNRLHVFNLKEMRLVTSLSAPLESKIEHTGLIRSVDISHDGRWCVSCGEDGKIIVWNVELGIPEALCIMDGYAKAVVFSHDACSLLTAKSRFIENWFVDWVLQVGQAEYPPPVWGLLG